MDGRSRRRKFFLASWIWLVNGSWKTTEGEEKRRRRKEEEKGVWEMGKSISLQSRLLRRQNRIMIAFNTHTRAMRNVYSRGEVGNQAQKWLFKSPSFPSRLVFTCNITFKWAP